MEHHIRIILLIAGDCVGGLSCEDAKLKSEISLGLSTGGIITIDTLVER